MQDVLCLPCGIDEAGRGPLAGPVFAAAVILPSVQVHDLASLYPGLNDSKKLSAKKRALLARQIWQSAKVGVGKADVQEIDTLNILQASMLAMRRAFSALITQYGHELQVPHAVRVDGNRCPDLSGIIPTDSLDIKAIIGGDAIEPCISAASIIAKTQRDELMSEMAKQYPQYGFDRHFGYPTAAHISALQAFGPCPQHRTSFAPVRAAVMRVSCS